MKFSSAILAVLMLLTASTFAASKHPALEGNTSAGNSSASSPVMHEAALLAVANRNNFGRITNRDKI